MNTTCMNAQFKVTSKKYRSYQKKIFFPFSILSYSTQIKYYIRHGARTKSFFHSYKRLSRFD